MSVWCQLPPRLADQEPGRSRARRGWDTAGGQWSRRAKNCVRGVMNYSKQRGRPTNPPRPQARVSRDAALSRAKRRFAQCRLCLIDSQAHCLSGVRKSLRRPFELSAWKPARFARFRCPGGPRPRFEPAANRNQSPGSLTYARVRGGSRGEMNSHHHIMMR